MAHNLHYILTNAEDKEQAQRIAEYDLDKFGDENNYYDIRYVLEIGSAEDKEQLEKIVKELNSLLGSDRIDKTVENIDRLQVLASSNGHYSCSNRHYYWQISQEYRRLYELLGCEKCQPVTIDTLVNHAGYYEFQFDEYGLTNMIFNNGNDSDKNYLIVVDMHS